MTTEPRPLDPTSRRARWVLVGVAIATAALYVVPYGAYVIYPLMLFSTYAHEMGHGITAVLMGGEFRQFQMWGDGSGVAQHAGHYGGFAKALISAGGLVGPAVLGAAFFAIARRPVLARAVLFAFGVISVLAVALVVRNWFGVGFVLALAAICVLVAWLTSSGVAQFVMVFFAVQLSLTVFSRGDYLFTEYAQTSAGRMPSDVTQISNALGGPYWFWGAFMGLFSVAVLVFGVWLFFRAGDDEEAEAA